MARLVAEHGGEYFQALLDFLDLLLCGEQAEIPVHNVGVVVTVRADLATLALRALDNVGTGTFHCRSHAEERGFCIVFSQHIQYFLGKGKRRPVVESQRYDLVLPNVDVGARLDKILGSGDLLFDDLLRHPAGPDFLHALGAWLEGVDRAIALDRDTVRHGFLNRIVIFHDVVAVG